MLLLDSKIKVVFPHLLSPSDQVYLEMMSLSRTCIIGSWARTNLNCSFNNKTNPKEHTHGITRCHR